MHRCSKCGSGDLTQITVRPPKLKKRGDSESRTAHRCTPACDRTVTFCRTCHFTH